MLNHATSQKRPPALSLSYPNLPRRVGECIFGSMRRDAIKALRAATAEQWSYSSEPVPSVCVGTGISHSVLFQYDADNTLTSVQLTSTQGFNRSSQVGGLLIPAPVTVCVLDISSLPSRVVASTAHFPRSEGFYHGGADCYAQIAFRPPTG